MFQFLYKEYLLVLTIYPDVINSCQNPNHYSYQRDDKGKEIQK